MNRHAKKILTILAVLSLLVMTGCSQPVPAKKDIVGVWKCEDAQKMMDAFLGIINISSGLVDVDLTLEFREDNTYEITGSVSVVFYATDMPSTVGTYTYDNGELYIDGKKFDGLKLSGDNLTLEEKDSSGHIIRIPFKRQH